jgi:hypothetical protein
VRTLLSLTVVHWLTSIGVIFTTASALVFLALAFQRFENPYFGIVVFLIVPAFFVLGLLLMPAGLMLASRRAGGFRRLMEHLPSETPRATRFVGIFLFATVANAAILTAAAYQGLGYMDSTQFCGQACHSVMAPQYVRYQHSRHAQIPCVDCHIGSGASSFIQYKLAGVRQLVSFTRNTYHRPIPTAIDRMRPAAETCGHCHSEQSSKDDQLKVIRHYDNDEESTPKFTVLLMRVKKIHDAHVSRGIVMDDGRTMDCLNCHNRSGHDFETPETAIDKAIASGALDRSRPFTRRDAVAALKMGVDLENQPPVVQTIYAENVFPRMMISWETYPNNIGHERSPGCFGCHDGEKVDKSGEPLTQDCAACHEMVVVDEADPQILKDLGIIQ